MNVDLNKLGNGALQSRFNREMEKVVNEYLEEQFTGMEWISVLA